MQVATWQKVDTGLQFNLTNNEIVFCHHSVGAADVVETRREHHVDDDPRGKQMRHHTPSDFLKENHFQNSINKNCLVTGLL